jgi:membrane protein implicated in regulation of membrane protease activity
MATSNITGFLQSAPGEFSSGRLMFMIWGVLACVMTEQVWLQTHDWQAASAIFISISGVAVAHKGVSSYNESKTPDGNTKTTAV